MDNTFETKGNRQTKNKIFEADREASSKLGIFQHPSITINNMTYRGEMNGHDIFKAVCAGFKDKPKECIGNNVYALMGKESDINTATFTADPEAAQKWFVVACVSLIILLNIVCIQAYRYFTKQTVNREINMQVNSAVSQYFALSGQDNANQSLRGETEMQ